MHFVKRREKSRRGIVVCKTTLAEYLKASESFLKRGLIPAVRQTVRRYVQQHALRAELPGMPPLLKYDGVTELWYDDFDALARCFSDPEYLAKVRPDEEYLFDIHACDFLVSAVHPVLA